MGVTKGKKMVTFEDDPEFINSLDVLCKKLYRGEANPRSKFIREALRDKYSSEAKMLEIVTNFEQAISQQ